MNQPRFIAVLGLLGLALAVPAAKAQLPEAPAQTVPSVDERDAVRRMMLEREQELALQQIAQERERAQLEQARREREREIAREQTALEQLREQQERALAREQAALEQSRRRLEEMRMEIEAAARDVATLSVSNIAPTWQTPAARQQTQAAWQVLASPTRGRLGIDVVDTDKGALVTHVMPGTPAEEAGIEAGDFVQAIDSVSLTDADGSPSELLTERLREAEAGETVGFAIERAGQRLDLDVAVRESADAALFFRAGADPVAVNLNRRLGQNDNQIVVVNEDIRGREVFPGINVIRTFGFASQPWADMELVALTEDLGRYFNASEGLLVVRAPSSDAIDLRDGDVILTIGTRTPSSPEHAMRILGSFEAGERIELEIMRDGSRYTSGYAVP